MSEFVHLNVMSDLSPGKSGITVYDLVNKAKKYNMKYLAITDDGNMFGVQDFYWSCRRAGITPIIGCKIKAHEGDKLTLIAMNNTGYHNLMHLSTLNMTTGVKEADLEKYSKDLICLSGSYSNNMHKALLSGDNKSALKTASFYKALFKDRFYFELINNAIDKEKLLISFLVKTAEKLEIKCVATNDGRINTQKEMKTLFAEYPTALSNAVKVAERCAFEIDFEGPKIPDFPIPKGYKDSFDYLRFLAFQGLNIKGLSSPLYVERLEYELEKFKSQQNIASYFLIIWDYINWAKSQDILCYPGLGNSPSSLLCYCLGITNIDPINNNLFFESFFKDFNASDVGIEVEADRRDEVENYIVKKYGEEKTARIVCIEKTVDTEDDCHIHNYGVAISRDDISNHVPLFNYQTEAGPIKTIQYSFDDLQAHGVIDFSILGFQTLTFLKDSERKIRKKIPEFSLDRIPENDADTLGMVAKGYTDSIYLLEPEQVKKWLIKIKPETWDEVMDIISLCKSEADDLLSKYMDAKNGTKNEDSIDPCAERILRSTHGIMIYEGQFMQIVHEFSGLSLSSANIMRRILQSNQETTNSVLNYSEKAESRGHDKGNNESL